MIQQKREFHNLNDPEEEEFFDVKEGSSDEFLTDAEEDDIRETYTDAIKTVSETRADTSKQPRFGSHTPTPGNNDDEEDLQEQVYMRKTLENDEVRIVDEKNVF